ncbi:glycine cleavage system protein GcvH [soil metagenome]
MQFPENLKYTSDHEWVNLEGNSATMGITDFAQGELGDIIYLDITVSMGDEVKKGDVLGSIEAVKTVSDVYSPISGKILEINSAINDNPSVINVTPYTDGWMIKIEPNNMDEISNLIDLNAYKEQIGV